MAQSVVWFSSINRSSLGTAGGKGANLGELYNSKFPIPNGFVVTSDAYKEFLEVCQDVSSINESNAHFI